MHKWRSPVVAFIAALQLLVGGAFAPPNMASATGSGHHGPGLVATSGMAHRGHIHHAAAGHDNAGRTAAAHELDTQHRSDDRPCDTRCCDHCASCLGTVSVPAARVSISYVIEVPAAPPATRFDSDVAPSSAPAYRLPFPLGPPTDRI